MYGTGKAMELQVIKKHDGVFTLYNLDTGRSYTKKIGPGEEEIEVNTFIQCLDTQLTLVPLAY